MMNVRRHIHDIHCVCVLVVRAAGQRQPYIKSVMTQMNLTFTPSSEDKSYRLELFQNLPSNATMRLTFEAVKIQFGDLHLCEDVLCPGLDIK